jgi:hypothetical protein
MENETEQNEHNINNKDFDEYYFKLWKSYEEVAMHFNDLIIRLRIQSIGGLAALATVLGIVLKTTNGIDETFNYGLAITALIFLMLCWIAIWVLDLRYYNRLLEGSVNAILELEKNKESFFEKKEINLSTNIERAFKVRFEHEINDAEIKGIGRKKNFINGRKWFYGIVFFALVIVFLSTICMWRRDCNKTATAPETNHKTQISNSN